MQGVVKWFNHTKGYGFLKEDNCDAEWFVHFNNSYDRILEGDKVEFEEGVSKNGKPCAINVKRLKSDGR